MIDEGKLEVVEGMLAEAAWTYFDARLARPEFEQRLAEIASPRDWHLLFRSEGALRKYWQQRARVGMSLGYVLQCWLTGEPTWPSQYSIDAVRARERRFMDDGHTLVVIGSAVYLIEERRQAEGPVHAVVHLARTPDRVVGYAIKFLTQGEPIGGPKRREQGVDSPAPPDAWRFVFTKGPAPR